MHNRKDTSTVNDTMMTKMAVPLSTKDKKKDALKVPENIQYYLEGQEKGN